MNFEMFFMLYNSLQSFYAVIECLRKNGWYYGVYSLGLCDWWTKQPFYMLGEMGSIQESSLLTPQQSIVRTKAVLKQMSFGFSPAMILSKKIGDSIVDGHLAYYEPHEEGKLANMCFSISSSFQKTDDLGFWNSLISDTFSAIALSESIRGGIGGFEIFFGEMNDTYLIESLNRPTCWLPPAWCIPKELADHQNNACIQQFNILKTTDRVLGLHSKGFYLS